ncbi:TPA: hypothetical protein N0F65_000696 [Lagenidium giganteum]|uniref:RNase H type-1 domain-containing protein n=1 Tax=Lagenidium giganteum TaxID=4803 RepID=A0AAV2YTN4_9STRA|nr:TPA: hypothetical protein N0F65_000696 [Lagenidium giganteum]
MVQHTAHASVTNNYAEYRALCKGLGHLAEHGIRQVQVVGDSAMIVRQMQTHRAPKVEHLRPHYLQARRFANKVNNRSWWHHRRSHNKMADAAANVAMNVRTSHSIAGDALSRWEEVYRHCGTDMTHWFAHTHATHE